MAATELFTNPSQANVYRAARPSYPGELYDVIAKYLGSALTECNAVDVGCGSGQATADLSKRVNSVVGVDPSAAQITEASQGPNIEYRQGTGEATGLPIASVELFTCAQAMHWCDPVGFYSEAARVLRPIRVRAENGAAATGEAAQGLTSHATGPADGRGGVVAVWGYDLHSLHPLPDVANDPVAAGLAAAVDKLHQDLYHNTLSPQYWNPNRDKVHRHLRDPGLAPHGSAMGQEEAQRLGLEPVDGAELARQAGLPVAGDGRWFRRVARWAGTMDAVWSLEQVVACVRSWSGYVTYMKRHGYEIGCGQDPAGVFEGDALRLFKEAGQAHGGGTAGVKASDVRLQVRWRLFMLLAERTEVEVQG